MGPHSLAGLAGPMRIAFAAAALGVQLLPAQTEQAPPFPTQGSGYAPSRVAVIDQFGMMQGAVGDPADCLRVDGATTPCGIEPSFVDGEVPSGAIDGQNALLTLSSAPSPATSLQLYRNGVLQKRGEDFTMEDNAITFLAASIPQTGDLLQAYYRVTTGTTRQMKVPRTVQSQAETPTARFEMPAPSLSPMLAAQPVGAQPSAAQSPATPAVTAPLPPAEQLERIKLSQVVAAEQTRALIPESEPVGEAPRFSAEPRSLRMLRQRTEIDWDSRSLAVSPDTSGTRAAKIAERPPSRGLEMLNRRLEERTAPDRAVSEKRPAYSRR